VSSLVWLQGTGLAVYTAETALRNYATTGASLFSAPGASPDEYQAVARFLMLVSCPAMLPMQEYSLFAGCRRCNLHTAQCRRAQAWWHAGLLFACPWLLLCVDNYDHGLLQSVLKSIIALRNTSGAQSVTAAPLDLTNSNTVTSLLTVRALVL
jgi:hypothetical protein